MLRRNVICAIATAAALLTTFGSAQAFDETKYPDLGGQWDRIIIPGIGGQPSFDQTKGWGRLQQAPLTPEYQKILEDSLLIRKPAAMATMSSTRAVSTPGCPG